MRSTVFSSSSSSAFFFTRCTRCQSVNDVVKFFEDAGSPPRPRFTTFYGAIRPSERESLRTTERLKIDAIISPAWSSRFVAGNARETRAENSRGFTTRARVRACVRTCTSRCLGLLRSRRLGLCRGRRLKINAIKPTRNTCPRARVFLLRPATLRVRKARLPCLPQRSVRRASCRT